MHLSRLLFTWFCLLLLGTGLGACSSAPSKPVDELEQASLAIAGADRANAAILAPDDFQRARETQQSAVEAAANNEFAQARFLAQLATVQAQLAQVHAERIRAEANLERLLTQME